jgi:hypothetical protein
MKKASLIAFFVYLISLVGIIYINIINNKISPKVICKEVKELKEQEQDSMEALVAIPEISILRQKALYEASLID